MLERSALVIMKIFKVIWVAATLFVCAAYFSYDGTPAGAWTILMFLMITVSLLIIIMKIFKLIWTLWILATLSALAFLLYSLYV